MARFIAAAGGVTDVFDAATDGRPIKIVSIVDEHTRLDGEAVEFVDQVSSGDVAPYQAVDRGLSGRAALRQPRRARRRSLWPALALCGRLKPRV
jgi:hypothetical protein